MKTLRAYWRARWHERIITNILLVIYASGITVSLVLGLPIMTTFISGLFLGVLAQAICNVVAFGMRRSN